jgi:hypothetical protein
LNTVNPEIFTNHLFLQFSWDEAKVQTYIGKNYQPFFNEKSTHSLK